MQNPIDDWLYLNTRNWKDYRRLLMNCIKYYDSDNPVESILDIGCGNGEFLETCKHYGINSVGLEVRKEAVSICVEKGLNVIEFDLAANHFPYPDNSVSIINCNQLIEHLTKDDGINLLKEIYRILKVNGLLLIYSPSFYNKTGRTMPFHLYCWKPKELGNQLSDLGFRDTKFLFNPIQWYHFLRFNPECRAHLSLRKQNFFELITSVLLRILYFITGAKILAGSSNFVTYKR